MKPWKISFWTPGNAPTDNGFTFGCASHGLISSGIWSAPEDSKAVFAANSFQGEVIAGSHGEVLERLRQISFVPKAAIIIFTRGAGAEAFLKQWHALLPLIPVVGGAAACSLGEEGGELLPAAEDVSVLLISEGSWKAETLNVHDTSGQAWEFRASGSRIITHLRRSGTTEWQAAAGAFRSLQIACGRTKEDCESITFSDAKGRNLHCSISGSSLHIGADLPAEGLLILRTVSRAAAAEKLRQFCAESNAIVFGCAGLRTLLDEPFEVGTCTLTGFMFGELVTFEKAPWFGNLMATRLLAA
jgi:hypothetical protein